MSSRAASAGSPRAKARVKAKAAPRFRVSVRVAVLFVLVAILAVSAVYPVRLYLEQRHEIATLEQQSLELQRTNARYEGQIAQLQDPKYLEQLARDCLGMVKRGETAFVIVPRRGQPQADACIPAPIP